MVQKIFIGLDPQSILEYQLEKLQRLTNGRELVISRELADTLDEIGDQVEIGVGWRATQVVEKTPNLRWFQQMSAGSDWLLKNPQIASREFILTNASGVHAVPISEHIMAMVFAFARGLHTAIQIQPQQDWQKDRDEHVFELAGKNMLLVGVGAIGERTAMLAKAAGMHVTGVRRDPSIQVDGVEDMVGPELLKTVLPDADIIALTIPHTTETEHMFDREAFQLMKPAAYLINIGRGGTVDETALVDALQNGALAGAGLDVFEEEPLPSDSPLWKMKNVIITRHYAGRTPRYVERLMDIFLDNLERYNNGIPLRNVVDKELGY